MNLDAELAQLHKPLLRYAQLQLRNDSVAEDVVSETLLAILEKPDAFAGRSSLRTYATGVLKHKIVDVMRRSGRELHIEPLDEQSLDEAIDAMFVENGHWRDPPPAWQSPERAFEQAQFFETLQACIDRLPPKLGRIFMMREWLEMEVPQLCDELAITSSNCGVMLYRARMQLRECLDRQWFGRTDGQH
jgi:RNA polymerase sigma-70 factor, ECF subfamily